MQSSVEKISCISLLIALFIGMPLASAREADFEQAQKLVKQKKWAEAAVLYRSILGESGAANGEDNPEQVEIILEFSKVLTFAGRREEALSVLIQRANREKGNTKKVLLRRLDVLSRQFLTEATFKAYQEGLQLMNGRKPAEAALRLENAFSNEPDNIEILVRLGQAYVLKKDFDKAVEKLREARRFNPFESEIQLWLGRALHQRGNAKEGIESLGIAQKTLLKSELAAVWYAEAIFSVGQKQNAITLLEKQTHRSPMQLQALLTLSRLRLLSSVDSDTSTLWTARKDLQLGLSRVSDYDREKPGRFEGPLGLDLRNSKVIREEMSDLLERVSGKLEGKPPVSPKPEEEIKDI